jgi:NADH dehydrogenase
MTTVVVFGGSGFLGRRLVRRLAGDGLTVRVAVRHPAPARRILKAAGLDRVMPRSRPPSPEPTPW